VNIVGQAAQRPPEDAGAAVASDQPHSDAADPADVVGTDAESRCGPCSYGITDDELVDGYGHTLPATNAAA
jgi:hypothetical protein